jgi:FkbM family methyltransferase
MLKRLSCWLQKWFGMNQSLSREATLDQANLYEATSQASVNQHDQEQHLVPYDENLLEKTRVQWQFGDWESLAKLDRDTLQHHPDRAKLALLAAAGKLQQGDAQTARKYIRLASDWGCGKTLVSQILIAGVHNNLGRAAAIVNQQANSLQHFERAIMIGSPNSDVRLFMQARYTEQLSQIGILPNEKFISQASKVSSAGGVKTFSPLSAGDAIKNGIYFDYSSLTSQFLHNMRSYILSSTEADCAIGLKEISESLKNIAKDVKPREMAVTKLFAHGKTFYFAHVAGDYIPCKIGREQEFYESKFLNVLKFFYYPDSLIIDVGANIGNHTVYFAKIIGAKVIAIEPEPHNAACLAINMELNDISEHVQLIHFAIGHTHGNIALQMNVEANYGSFTARPDSNPNRGVVSETMLVHVPMITLDSLAIQADSDAQVSMIKLDVEGMELEALKGGCNLIQKSYPLIAVECFSHKDFLLIESFLEPYKYFPIEILNVTPTFLFVSRNNLFHMARLICYLRDSVIDQAIHKKGFL